MAIKENLLIDREVFFYGCVQLRLINFFILPEKLPAAKVL